MIRRPARGFDSRWARRWRDGGTDTVSAQEYFDYYAGWARIYEAGEIISSDVSVRAEINISQHPRVDPYAIDARLLDGVTVLVPHARRSSRGRVVAECTQLTG